MAARQSILAVFPEADVRHCLFHFFHNLFKNIQRKGLAELYRDCLEARALLRCLPALAFLPPEEVRDGLEAVVVGINGLLEDDIIEQRFEVPLMEYLEYFQRTYVYQLRGPHGARRLVDPLYPPRFWNVCASVQEGVPRTC